LKHELILAALAEHIQDGRCLTLVKKLLDAGYMADWKFKRTRSGVPQGSILSPVLSNILLSKRDRCGETELLPQSNRGGRSKANQVSRSLIKRAHRLRRQGQKEAAQKSKRQAQKLPAIDPQDPDYRRRK
jgi:retron-type reverse transcriptase